MPSYVQFLSITCSCYIRDSHGCRRHSEVIPVCEGVIMELRDALDDAQLRNLIAQGENEQLEFKRAGEGPKPDLYETICSFANHAGGLIVLGLEDDGTPIGVNPRRIKEYQQNIVNVLHNPQTFSAAPHVHFQEKECDRKLLLCLFIESSPDVIRYKNETYDRVFDVDVRLHTTSQLASLYNRKLRIYSEEQILPFLSIEDFNPAIINRARDLAVTRNSEHPWKRMTNGELLRYSSLWRKDFRTNESGYTLAAALLFGNDDVISSVCPTYSVDAVVRIINQDRYDARETVQTNLLDSYERLYRFLIRYLPDPFYLENQQRVSSKQIVVRELLSNILMHQEFTSPLPAQIEVTSEGIATKNASVSEFEGYLQVDDFTPIAKNPKISDVFREIGYADKLGSGVRNLQKMYPAFSSQKPEFHDGKQFVSRFHINGALLQLPESAMEEKTPVNDVDRAIEDLLSSQGTISAQELAEKAQVTVRTANRHITDFVTRGKLRKVESRGRGYRYARS